MEKIKYEYTQVFLRNSYLKYLFFIRYILEIIYETTITLENDNVSKQMLHYI